MESSLSGRKKPLENTYRKMLIIPCTIGKFYDEIMLMRIHKLLVLHFVVFRKQASITHFLYFWRPRHSPVKEPRWQLEMLPSQRKPCLHILSSLFLKNQGRNWNGINWSLRLEKCKDCIIIQFERLSVHRIAV